MTKGHFYPFQVPIQGPRGPKMAIFYGKNQPKTEGLLQAGPSHLESAQCAISHTNAWESMTRGHICPFQAPIQSPRGPKMAIFHGKIASKGRAASKVRYPTWKVSGTPYHIPIHGRARLRAIFTLSRYPSRVPGVQKWLFSMAKLHL